MHSTVQTGSYTQNIFGFEHNFYHPRGNNAKSQSNFAKFPPPPHNYHPKHHLPPVNHYHCEVNEHGKLNPIDKLTGSNRKLNEGHDQCKNPLCISITNMNNNIENDKYDSRLGTLLSKFKYFWQCTKPCGILALVFGFLLLSGSIIGFLYLHVDLLCEKAQTCFNATLRVLSIAFLVISIVIMFFGFVIIIYSKRDPKATVLVASTKQFDNLDISLMKPIHHQRQISASQLNLSNNKVNLSVSSRNIPQMFGRSNSYLTITIPSTDGALANKPLLKSTLNKSKSASTSRLNEKKL
jgi:hypothetical protein